MTERGEMTVEEAGRRGGQTTLEKYGIDHLSSAGRKGGLSQRDKLGPEGYAKIGKLGGQKVLAQRGSEFFSEIGKKGGMVVSATRGPQYYREIAEKSHLRPRSPLDLSLWQETVLSSLLEVDERGSLRFTRILHASDYINQEKLRSIRDHKERARVRCQVAGSFYQIAQIGVAKLVQSYPDPLKIPRLVKLYQWLEENHCYQGKTMEEIGLIVMRKTPLL